MKRLFYFVLLLAGVSSLHSCKDLADEDGNPLLDTNTTTGLTGPRALHQEVDNSHTIATYFYNGLQLSRVLTDSASVTNVAWSGNKVSTIDFKGFLDLDDDKKLDKDSIVYTQLYTYGGTGRLETISENRSLYHRITTSPFSVANPSPQTLYKRVKTKYTIAYAAATGKLDLITMESGPEATPFVNTDYSTTKFEYMGDNVAQLIKNIGPMNGGVPGTPTEKYSYGFSNYDVNISPFTLLPTAYKISRLISTNYKGEEGLIFSPNSPRRKTLTDLMEAIPVPQVASTDYRYDPQTYMTVGYTINYIYKPL